MQNKSKQVIAVLYGLWIAFVYLAFKYFIPGRMIEGFSLGSIFGALILCPFYWKAFISTTRQPAAWIRGICFGLTQLFTFRALSSGDTFAVFASSSAVVLLVAPLSKVISRDMVGAKDVFIAMASCAGLMLIAHDPSVTLNAALAGLFQALSIVVARRSAKAERVDILGNVILGLFLAGVLTSTSITISPSQIIDHYSLILSCAALIVITQIYFIWISFQFLPIFTNQVSLTRIVWSIAIESVVAMKLPEVRESIGAVTIFISAIYMASSRGQSNS